MRYGTVQKTNPNNGEDEKRLLSKVALLDEDDDDDLENDQEASSKDHEICGQRLKSHHGLVMLALFVVCALVAVTLASYSDFKSNAALSSMMRTSLATNSFASSRSSFVATPGGAGAAGGAKSGGGGGGGGGGEGPALMQASNPTAVTTETSSSETTMTQSNAAISGSSWSTSGTSGATSAGSSLPSNSAIPGAAGAPVVDVPNTGLAASQGITAASSGKGDHSAEQKGSNGIAANGAPIVGVDTPKPTWRPTTFHPTRAPIARTKTTLK